MSKIHNIPTLKEKRRELRQNLTPAEASLWSVLKNKQLEGRKFRRQHSVGNYILDFYCASEKLCLELDGAYHYTPMQDRYDTERTTYLNSLGIKVVRFENKEVFEHIDRVLDEIKNNFTTPTPPKIGGE